MVQQPVTLLLEIGGFGLKQNRTNVPVLGRYHRATSEVSTVLFIIYIALADSRLMCTVRMCTVTLLRNCPYNEAKKK